jgi:hypothetical protein
MLWHQCKGQLNWGVEMGARAGAPRTTEGFLVSLVVSWGFQSGWLISKRGSGAGGTRQRQGVTRRKGTIRVQVNVASVTTTSIQGINPRSRSMSQGPRAHRGTTLVSKEGGWRLASPTPASVHKPYLVGGSAPRQPKLELGAWRGENRTGRREEREDVNV